MRTLFTITIILLALAACTAPQAQTPEPAATGIPTVNMPNPASVYCEQHGNKLEIHTAVDGSQFGVCVFPDGSVCDEWAYFRGECGPGAQASPTPAKTVKPTPKAGVEVTEEQASGSDMPPGATEKISDWWGIITSTPLGAQYDDYFERQDLGQKLNFGIDSLDPGLQYGMLAAFTLISLCYVTSLIMTLVKMPTANGYTLSFSIGATKIGRMYPWNTFFAIGMALVVIGFIIRIYSILTLNQYFTYSVAKVENHTLIETGLYKFIRHPGYLGQLMIFLRISISVSNWFSILLMMIPISIGYLSPMSIEEKFMSEQFGEDYLIYQEHTKKIIPLVYQSVWREPTRFMSISQSGWA